jgi:hypothetical protein
MDLKETGCNGVEWLHHAQGRIQSVVGSREDGSELSCSHKSDKFIDQLSDL